MILFLDVELYIRLIFIGIMCGVKHIIGIYVNWKVSVNSSFVIH